MTDIIQELRGLIAKATPGEWAIGHSMERNYIYAGNHHLGCIASSEDGYPIHDDGSPNEADSNAALIVAAINHLPALLDRLEAAERVTNAARDYAGNYLLDEREDPTLCFEEIQHERIIELFDALDAPAIREVKP